MKKKILIGAAIVGVATVGAVGGAFAVASGDDDGENVTGPKADQAISAALEETGGGTANSVELDDESEGDETNDVESDTGEPADDTNEDDASGG